MKACENPPAEYSTRLPLLPTHDIIKKYKRFQQTNFEETSEPYWGIRVDEYSHIGKSCSTTEHRTPRGGSPKETLESPSETTKEELGTAGGTTSERFGGSTGGPVAPDEWPRPSG